MNFSFLLVILLSLSACLYCKKSLKNIKNLAAEKVNTLNGATAPQMLAYTSSSSYPTLSDLQAWTNYHKESGRLDNILNKCYECIRDRNKDDNYRRPHRINPALNTFTEPRWSDTNIGSLAENLNGPVVHVGGLFVSSSVGQSRGANRAYGSGYGSSNSYGSNYVSSGNVGGNGGGSYGGVHRITTSLTCMVGLFGESAYPTACEYGNSYCQIINYNAGQFVGACVEVCVPLTFTTCFTGTLSNKVGPICLVGNLNSGSVAVPVGCNPGEQCQYDTDTGIVGCTNGNPCRQSETIICSSSDYPFESLSITKPRGPLCYIGVFGSATPTIIPGQQTSFPRGKTGGAILVACGNTDVCQTVTDSTGLTTGSCARATGTGSCVNSTTTPITTCTTLDYANKQGPICYVGDFGVNAQPHACARGQFCQRTSYLTVHGMTISTGSCATNCIPGGYTYCCKTDLCNAYDTTLNHKKCETSYESNEKEYSY